MQGTFEFMSDDLLRATELDVSYLQCPVDDLYSLYYTMQWAAVFHNREFTTGKDVPSYLRVLREDISGDQRARTATTHTITYAKALGVDKYGQFLADCHPFLRAWYLSLQDLLHNWTQIQSKLEKSGMKESGRVYPYLFLVLAVEGVAQLAELVDKCSSCSKGKT